MLLGLTNEQVSKIREVLMWQIECEDGDPEQKNDVEEMRSIVRDIDRQSADQVLFDKICDYKCVRRLDEAVFECAQDFADDIEEYLPEGKTIYTCLYVDDKIPDEEE